MRRLRRTAAWQPATRELVISPGKRPVLVPAERSPSDEYRALDHPARRRIMELLGTRESISFSELRAETGLPVGTLYYHLDVLRGLVTQDSSRRYLLSKEGIKLYASLADKEGLPHLQRSRSLSILPGWIFASLEGSVIKTALIWLAVAATGGALSYFGGQALVLMHFGVSVFPNWVDVSLFPLSMLIYLVYSLASTYLLSGRGTNLPGLLASGVVYLPYLVLPLTTSIISPTAGGGTGLVYLILTILVQGSSVILGATYMSSTFGMRLERSLLLQLVFYVAATVTFTALQYLGLIAEAGRVAAQVI